MGLVLEYESQMPEFQVILGNKLSKKFQLWVIFLTMFY